MEIGGHSKGKFCLVDISIHLVLSGWIDISLSSAHFNRERERGGRERGREEGRERLCVCVLINKRSF